MVRTIPWLSANVRSSREGGRSVKRPRKDEPSSDVDDSHSFRVKAPRRGKANRSPSSSPPPAPPTEEPMREGLDGDDRYIMIEDELLSVARLFTRHLHHAEYKRQLREARERNISAIADLKAPRLLDPALSADLLSSSAPTVGHKKTPPSETRNESRDGILAKDKVEKFRIAKPEASTDNAKLPLNNAEIEDDRVDARRSPKGAEASRPSSIKAEDRYKETDLLAGTILGKQIQKSNAQRLEQQSLLRGMSIAAASRTRAAAGFKSSALRERHPEKTSKVKTYDLAPLERSAAEIPEASVRQEEGSSTASEIDLDEIEPPARKSSCRTERAPKKVEVKAQIQAQAQAQTQTQAPGQRSEPVPPRRQGAAESKFERFLSIDPRSAIS